MRYLRLAVAIGDAFARFAGRAWVNTWTPGRLTLALGLAGAAVARYLFTRH